MITKNNINKIFKIFQKANPEPKTELNFETEFQLLIAVLLSAQAQDKTVNKATATIFKEIKAPIDLDKYSQIALEKKIKTIGLYRNKAKNIKATADILENKYSGIVPRNRKDLEILPGIGNKSAAVILNELEGKLYIGVDTHVSRVSNRLGIVNEKNPKIIEKKLLEIIPDWAKKDAHHWLVLHGRYVCKSRKPDCKKCKINNFCQYYIHNQK